MAESYVTPWTLRVNDSFRGHPFWLGIGFIPMLLAAWVSGVILAWIGLMFPLRGMQRSEWLRIRNWIGVGKP